MTNEEKIDKLEKIEAKLDTLKEAIEKIFATETEPHPLLDALHEIAKMGANPITGYGCKTRKDFMVHVDKMWQIAFAAINRHNGNDT